MSEEQKLVISSARRKTARATCYIYAGKGRVFVNNVPIELIPIEMVRLKIMEPLLLAGNDIRSKIDAKIITYGGGIMGQADAARMALARALVKFTGSKELEKIYRAYDRTMLAGDPRQTESEKWMRYSARRWRQKSYR
ncbi:30S ribosomal protein S9 [Saccharolobus solfataricus]|uniref:Small ribosomal subunit protein uS9 n=4 Tax=Saccharolobus solfataricus TaxID=2287 RepID=RS9_SACS2|nr:30S ribosomal protein S9 [Saccharolobus solfataricus]P95992.3 RecName: Full=Small ribosomal subunit protein uS9; AltName: Full=30S ribosomal protein S9 [Saccharolobus solfataricus P2]AKA73417.1 30S ribosomal protein S9 [Saccharolobus solfataricus]AKA76116.1 30S ribosomal protein S9 [Saccharolobus solfataricus]AKA78808.1 30S ribosomal protein S9 [Saccharolobus solfataricus]AZF67883.1 30S ribosomal protein S9 [Saccharolobus solfataricus]AZF70503.1 30S ribosomal protein S9 [Saccharolobus solf